MFKYHKRKIILLVFILCFTFTSHSLAATIVLDPGHGGSNPGAIGVNGLREKDVNFDVSLRLRDILSDRGYDVLLTREEDEDMSLDARVKFKERHRADLFVSIHANAYHNSTAQGSLVLYYDRRYPKASYPASPEMAMLTETNKQFAQTVLAELLAETQMVDQGIVPSSVYVVRKGTMPSILVELAFLTNWEDAARLADEQERERMAHGIANGIEKFWPLGMFRDVIGHWAREAIERLQDQGIVEGIGANYYPDRSLTRAEFLTIMDRVFHFTKDEGEDEGEHENGIENGYDNGFDDGFDNEKDEHESEHEVHGSEQDDVAEPGFEEVIVEGNDEEDEDEITQSFADIDHTHWAYDVLQASINLGIINGYPDGTVRPDEPINRAEVSVLFDRIWQGSAKSTSFSDLTLVSSPNDVPTFVDVPSHQWYASAVYRMKRASLIQGISETEFAPFRYMTRAEIAAIIDRYLMSLTH